MVKVITGRNYLPDKQLSFSGLIVFSSFKLDNGDNGPDKKYFTDVSYNELTRNFKGTVDWRKAKFEKVSINGGELIWVFDITFTKDFSAIESGTKEITIAPRLKQTIKQQSVRIGLCQGEDLGKQPFEKSVVYNEYPNLSKKDCFEKCLLIDSCKGASHEVNKFK